MNQRFARSFTCPLLIAFFSLGLLSCSKKIVSVTQSPAPANVDVQEIEFDYMHGKARMVYKDDKKEREVKTHIRIRKDSVIWMNFTVVGVQGGKALINQDSITIVSTVDREYYVFNYTDLSERFHFNVSYDIIEAAILGNLLQKRNGSDATASNGPFDVISQSQGEIKIRTAINKTTKKIEKVDLIEPTTGNTLDISYEDFQPLGDRSFPYNGTISVMYKTINGIINNKISFEWNKAEVGDKELKFPFKIPPKYDRR
jgi:hypothetical protein